MIPTEVAFFSSIEGLALEAQATYQRHVFSLAADVCDLSVCPKRNTHSALYMRDFMYMYDF